MLGGREVVRSWPPARSTAGSPPPPPAPARIATTSPGSSASPKPSCRSGRATRLNCLLWPLATRLDRRTVTGGRRLGGSTRGARGVRPPRRPRAAYSAFGLRLGVALLRQHG